MDGVDGENLVRGGIEEGVPWCTLSIDREEKGIRVRPYSENSAEHRRDIEVTVVMVKQHS